MNARIVKLVIFQSLIAASLVIHADTERLLELIQRSEQLINYVFPEGLANKVAKNKVKRIVESGKPEAVKFQELEKYIQFLTFKEAEKKANETQKPKKSEKLETKSPTDDAKNKKETEERPPIVKSLVTIGGKKSRGSGFVTEFNGKKVIITNAHVIFDDSSIQLRNCSNEPIKPSSVYFAQDRDIAIIIIDKDSPEPVLELQGDVSDVPLESNVAAYGNSQGQGANTINKGLLKGIGGKVIEVSTQFVAGNSGGPIISEETGKVVGVNTYTMKAKATWSNKDTRYSGIRRFGTRIDNLSTKKLLKLDMKDYKRDLARYLKLKKANELGKIIVDDIYEKRVDREGNIIYYPDLMPDRYVSYSNMKHIIQKWNGLIVGDSFSGSYHRVLSQIKDRISEPAETVRGKPSKYFFINEECKNLLQYNDLLINEFDGIDKRINAYQRQQNNKKNTGKRRLLL